MEKYTKVVKLLQGFIRYLKATNKPSTSMCAVAYVVMRRKVGKR